MFEAEEIAEMKGLRWTSARPSKGRGEINVTGNLGARSRVLGSKLDGWAKAILCWDCPAVIRIVGSILSAMGSY